MILSSKAFRFSTALLLCLGLSSSAWAKKFLNLSDISPEVRAEVYKRYPLAQHEKIALDQVDDIIRLLQ